MATTVPRSDAIKLGDVITYIADLEAKHMALVRAHQTLLENSFSASKFSRGKLTTEAVAALHNVHVATVRQYIKSKQIPLHPDSTDSKLYIEASTALLLDFKELRRGMVY